MVDICIGELVEHGFRGWLVAISGPSHYLNQYWHVIIVFTRILQDQSSVKSYVNNIGFIAVYGLNKGHIAPYTNNFKRKCVKNYCKIFGGWVGGEGVLDVCCEFGESWPCCDRLYHTHKRNIVTAVSWRAPIITPHNCHRFSNISRTQSKNINVSRLVLQLSLSNALKPGVKLRMRM